VATPGRLLDLMHRGVVSTSQIKFVVLDEADEMFGMGFQEDIDEILKRTPDTRRTWLFSATMPAAAERIARAYMQDPLEVSMGQRNVGAENIEHIYYVIKEKDRYAALKRLIDFEPDIYGLVFAAPGWKPALWRKNLPRRGIMPRRCTVICRRISATGSCVGSGIALCIFWSPPMWLPGALMWKIYPM
jgi:superfamily II DNA/RNA helicase